MGRIHMARLAALAVVVLLAGCQAAPAGPGRPPPAQVGEACGGIAGIACAGPGTFCDYAPSAMCGAADQMGTCREIPQICTREYRPVCSCDGQTYGNACGARAAGASIAYEGPCEE